MHWLDYAVVTIYFVVLIGVGWISSRHIKRQEDYFLGGRSFGKLLQTFAAFGAGTGSDGPVSTGRTTFTSGMSGMWSQMYWLFVTPFYWITGVWYRRMRHMTLGDWFVERYESPRLGAAYAVFGMFFYIVHGSMMFSAIAKFTMPLLQLDGVLLFGLEVPVEYVLVPLVGLVVLAYGIAGGLEAAYYTDVIQGICIILLSVILVPFGLSALVDRYAPNATSMIDGFAIMHKQIPPDFFDVIGGSSSEFPLHRIVLIVIINLIGIVVQPHFIATGGGSAKTEMDARVGLVVGNFLKRFCTLGWVLTALIALALFADHPELATDPDMTWGVASRELLGPGLRGLMLACLLAALMSSVDAYMVVSAGLLVRNIYAPFFRPNASEREYVFTGRLAGTIVVVGAVVVSLAFMDVFKQLQITWVVPMLFAAPFWVGMYWRGATTTGAWVSVIFGVAALFVVPYALPQAIPSIRSAVSLSATNPIVRTTTRRTASPTDVQKRLAEIANWQQAHSAAEAFPDPTNRDEALKQLGPQPTLLMIGDELTMVTKSGGTSLYWTGGVVPVDSFGSPTSAPLSAVVTNRNVDEAVSANSTVEKAGDTSHEVLSYGDAVSLAGQGNLRLDFLLYRLLGIDLVNTSDATLAAWDLPAKILVPFLIMIGVSWITPRNSAQALDGYYAKMKTPVVPDPITDAKNLTSAIANPRALDNKKLFPSSSLEFQRPSSLDIAGFVGSVIICFAIIGLLVWLGQIGK